MAFAADQTLGLPLEGASDTGCRPQGAAGKFLGPAACGPAPGAGSAPSRFPGPVANGVTP